MDELTIEPSLEEYVAERTAGGLVTLREHLAVLRTYSNGLYDESAQDAGASLDQGDLDQVPVGIEQEEAPFCVVYYLPDNRLVRILPDYNFEIQTWEEAEDEPIELDYDG